MTMTWSAPSAVDLYIYRCSGGGCDGLGELSFASSIIASDTYLGIAGQTVGLVSLSHIIS